jgi:uncharacterized membrane protein HdeD (DUF308 family)
MATDSLESAYRRTWWALVLRGLFGLAIGVVVLWKPLESTAAFALVIALWAIVTGFTEIVQAFDLQSVFSRWWVVLLSGLVSVGFGVAALYYYPDLSLTFIVVWVAWWLLFTGGLAVYLAIQERRLSIPWGWTLTFGILSIASGVAALFYPQVTLGAIMGLIAAFSIVSGVVLLFGAYKMASIKSDLAATFGSARPT